MQSSTATKRNFVCDICDRKFSKKDHIKTHFEQVHLKKKAKCRKCNKLFHPLALKRHQNEKCSDEKKKKSIVCDVCKKQFSRWSHLKKHQETIHKHWASTIEASNEDDLNNELWCFYMPSEYDE